jgi:hypothetical protein
VDGIRYRHRHQVTGQQSRDRAGGVQSRPLMFEVTQRSTSPLSSSSVNSSS